MNGGKAANGARSCPGRYPRSRPLRRPRPRYVRLTCVESRQAYQALKVARHPQDRSQRCSWSGAPPPNRLLQACAVKSLRAHALRSLISAREKLRPRADLTRASEACRRLMTIPGVGQLTALAFVDAIDDPSRIRRSRDIGAYLGLVPRRYQSGEVDYTGGISKCGDRRVRTLLYEAANVMLTPLQGPAFATSAGAAIFPQCAPVPANPLTSPRLRRKQSRHHQE